MSGFYRWCKFEEMSSFPASYKTQTQVKDKKKHFSSSILPTAFWKMS